MTSAQPAALCLLAVVAVYGALQLVWPDDPPPHRQIIEERRHLHKTSSRSVAAAAAAAAAPAAPSFTVPYEPWEQYKSQDGQDKWANENVFHGKRGGVFVDLGCYDGVTYSNTWYMERVLNWTGVCVEPNPEVYPRIASQAGRHSGVQLAVSDHRGVAPFVAAYMRSSLNASAVDYDFLASQGVSTASVNVELTTPAALLAAHLPRRVPIDYVNIDVEQLEVPILRVWPWEAHCVTLFNIENEPPKGAPSQLPQLKALLEPHGYTHKGRLGVDELFLRNSPCPRAAEPPPARRRAAAEPSGVKPTARRAAVRRRVLQQKEGLSRRPRQGA